MNPSDNPDPLQELLSADDVYIDDAGFTARVVTHLPTRQSWAWLRPALLLGATITGCVLGWLWIPWEDSGIASGTSYDLSLWQFGVSGTLAIAVFAAVAWGVIGAVLGEE